MEETSCRSSLLRTIKRDVTTLLCVVLLRPGGVCLFAQSKEAKNTDQSTEQKAEKVPPDQLDSLVAPIALYPDPLLAQTLAASTYPLEIIQLQQWLTKNPKLKEKELADAVSKQRWDPSVQALAALPDVVKRLAEDIQWTTDLGNAFLAQQSDVMDAVQRMRKKAKDKGNLKSNEQQKVETKVVESKTVIVVEQANPEVVYVPAYNPVVVYGTPVYAYPPIYYPPPGYYAAGMAISFGVGVAMGAMWSGGWGWGCGWGHNNVQINNYNNFNRNVNVNRNTNVNRNANVNRNTRNVAGGSANWTHNPQHRGGAPYADRATANQYGGTARGESVNNRQANARQQANRQSGSTPSSRATAGASSASRPSGAGAANGTGNRDLSRGSGASQNAFGGNGGYNGASARAAGNRGSSSMGGRSGGARAGGGRGRR